MVPDHSNDYPYAVPLREKFEDLRPLGMWCMENIGENAYIGEDLSVTVYSPDQKWVWSQGGFRFKDEKDACLFKMTWG